MNELCTAYLSNLDEDFPELDSNIVVALRKTNEEYAELSRQITVLANENRFIGRLIEGKGEVHMTAEEHDIFREYFRLALKRDNIERQELYFRGHTDAIAYLKKIKAI